MFPLRPSLNDTLCLPDCTLLFLGFLRLPMEFSFRTFTTEVLLYFESISLHLAYTGRVFSLFGFFVSWVFRFGAFSQL